MKTELQKQLATIAPSISILTMWDYDHDCGPISEECDGFDASEDHDWQAWKSEIRATAIIDGKEIAGSTYLGGTFEKVDDLPEYSNPTISGYEAGMTIEALEELGKRIEIDSPVMVEICRAIEKLEASN
jgi:hypothetical protein